MGNATSLRSLVMHEEQRELWEINSPTEQAGTPPAKTMERSTFTRAAISPLATVVVQFKKHLLKAYP